MFKIKSRFVNVLDLSGHFMVLVMLIVGLAVTVYAQIPISSNGSFTTPMVAAWWYHTVGLKSDGTVVAVGRNDYGQCNVSGWSAIVQVAAGGRHTAGLKSNRTVVAVGWNDDGQCNVGGWFNIVQVAAGGWHTVGLKSNSTVLAVGNNGRGQCNVSVWTDIVQVAAGNLHTVGLKSDGTVVAVGLNDYGQCSVSGWIDIVQVAAGIEHTVGLKSNGKVVAVGANHYGQCNISGWSDIVQIAAGGWHTLGLKSDGTVVAVGRNNYGQCNVSGWSDIVQVAAGEYYTVGLKSDGTVVAVGRNNYGQCNVGDWNLANSEPIVIVNFTFESDTEDWNFLGTITPYDTPLSAYEPGHLALCPDGSYNAFSFWESPDVEVSEGKLYRAKWLVYSDATDPDETVQFRLRINQKGSWQAWNRIVNSNKSQSPPPAKFYDVIIKPVLTGINDANLVFSFDLMSFDWGDDATSWLYLDELILEETQVLSQSEILSYNFDTGSEGWVFVGDISPYDGALSFTEAGEIAMSPDGSTNCFSFWKSPDVSIEDGKYYRLSFTVKSTAVDPDETVQFRLRCNQKGSWQAWNRIVNSNLGNAPGAGAPQDYQLFFNPGVTDTEDNMAVFSFDLMSFDWLDDVDSWLSLDNLVMEEITLSP